MSVYCPKCEKEQHTIFEAQESGRFVEVCGKCGSALSAPPPAPAPIKSAAAQAVAVVNTQPKPVVSSDPCAVLKARLQIVESQLTDQTSLRREAKRLRAAIKALEKPERRSTPKDTN